MNSFEVVRINEMLAEENVKVQNTSEENRLHFLFDFSSLS